ncbi:unnamed protein product, partial [Amoebophrya sp. A120]
EAEWSESYAFNKRNAKPDGETRWGALLARPAALRGMGRRESYAEQISRGHFSRIVAKEKRVGVGVRRVFGPFEKGPRTKWVDCAPKLRAAQLNTAEPGCRALLGPGPAAQSGPSDRPSGASGAG